MQSPYDSDCKIVTFRKVGMILKVHSKVLFNGYSVNITQSHM